MASSLICDSYRSNERGQKISPLACITNKIGFCLVAKKQVFPKC